MIISDQMPEATELVIGLVSPLGAAVDDVIEALSSVLKARSYTPFVVRLSGLLDQGVASASEGSPEYYREKMLAGDAVRARYNAADAVAALAVREIRRLRQSKRTGRVAFILRTLKRPEEAELLRAVYGSACIVIGVHQSQKSRRGRLTREFQSPDPTRSGMKGEAKALITRDHDDTDSPYGQRVSDTHSQADFFVRVGKGSSVDEQIRRLARLIFGEPYETPTQDELFMYLARGASLRSSDPGRQVGAVIVSPNSDVIAVGANEVPKAGGGEYWSGDEPDGRDFRRGVDPNQQMSRKVLLEVLNALEAADWLPEELAKVSGIERVDRLMQSRAGGAIRGSRVSSLIEFGRIVHAEMSAITASARGHQSTQGSTIYTTAFPCHMCMRLIISSGITRVVYVDPYPKSLALSLYKDSTTLKLDEDRKVHVEPFIGASWRVFDQVFRSRNRQRTNDGRLPMTSEEPPHYQLGDPWMGLSSEAKEDVVLEKLHHLESAALSD